MIKEKYKGSLNCIRTYLSPSQQQTFVSIFPAPCGLSILTSRQPFLDADSNPLQASLLPVSLSSQARITIVVELDTEGDQIF